MKLSKICKPHRKAKPCVPCATIRKWRKQARGKPVVYGGPSDNHIFVMSPRYLSFVLDEKPEIEMQRSTRTMRVVEFSKLQDPDDWTRHD